MEWEHTRILANLRETLAVLGKDHKAPDAALVNQLWGLIFNLKIGSIAPVGWMSPILSNFKEGMKAVYDDAKVGKEDQAYIKKLHDSGFATIMQDLKEFKAGLTAPVFGAVNLVTLGAAAEFAKQYRGVFEERQLRHGLSGTRERVRYLHGKAGLEKYDKKWFFRAGSDIRVLTDTLATVPLALMHGFVGGIGGILNTVQSALKQSGLPDMSDKLIAWGEKQEGVSPIVRAMSSFHKRIEEGVEWQKARQSPIPPPHKQKDH